MKTMKFSMRKMLLSVVVFVSICAFGYSYSENMIRPNAKTCIDDSSEREVVWVKKWDKYVGAYFLHFKNCRTDKRYCIAFKYLSSDNKYIDNRDYLGKGGCVKMCCGKDGLYKDLTITEY